MPSSRAAATMLLALHELASGRTEEAVAAFEVLAGRNHRFAEPVGRVRTVIAEGGEPGDAVAGLGSALAAQDRSADAVTAALADAFAEGLRR
jgi:hypothetical protein